jgi:hypothetical protein
MNDGGSANAIDGGDNNDTVTYAGRILNAANVSYDSFTSVETLTGSALNSDTLTGTGNADTFTVNALNDGSATLTAGGEVVNFTSFENLSGLGGNDTFNMNAGVAGTVDGGGGAGDVINGMAAANAFTVTAANGGTVNGTQFANVENLNGGAAADVFTVAAGGSLGGSIDGAGSDDELNVAGAAAVTVNLGDSSATVLNSGGANGYSSIESFVGNATDDVLVATANADTFDTTAANSGTVAGITYTNFANLGGGGGADIFNLQHNVGGNVDGGADADTFNLANGVTIGGAIMGGSGGNDDDELVAVGGPNAWSVTDDDTGALNGVAFSEIENLTGNDSVDTFTMTGALTGTASGMGGNDAFNLGNGGSAAILDGGAGTDSLSYAARTSAVTVNMAGIFGVENITGSGFNDTINIDGDEANEITINGGGGADVTVAVINDSQIDGNLTISGVNSLEIGADLDVGTNSVSLNLGGAITQSGPGGLLTAQSLSATTGGGQELTTAVGSYTGSSTGVGNIAVTNTGDLNVADVSQANGDVTIIADGSLTQSGDITSNGGNVSLTATAALTMETGTVTDSDGGNIEYIAGDDVTLGTLAACDNCAAGGGSVWVESQNGSILGNPGEPHISAVSAWLSADGNIGSETTPIKFDDMDPNGDAGDGEEISLDFGGTAIIDEGLFSFTVTEGSDASAVIAQGQASKNIASSDQAASVKEEDDVDWAAFSEDVTVYEINNDGVQLPQDQQTDEFAKLREEALKNTDEKETVSDATSIFDNGGRPEGIPVSQLSD